MVDFTPVPALLGGVLIGLGASVLLLGGGRILGVCGITGSLLDNPSDDDAGWRRAFLIGLVFTGLAGSAFSPALVGVPVLAEGPSLVPMLVVGGLLVGFGTRMANGCTSGHGVCGIARGSARSLAATATFMVTGGLTVYVVHHVLTGAP